MRQISQMQLPDLLHLLQTTLPLHRVNGVVYDGFPPIGFEQHPLLGQDWEALSTGSEFSMLRTNIGQQERHMGRPNGAQLRARHIPHLVQIEPMGSHDQDMRHSQCTRTVG